MTDHSLELLKSEVETILGRKILTASDCNILASDILMKTKNQISQNTLRRVFDLMESKYNPSSFTLDLLAQYCGYSSFSEFIKYRQKSNNQSTEQESGLLSFLTMLFRDVEARGLDDTTYCNLIREVLKNLQRWPHIIDIFQAKIAKTRNGQLFYYEQFVYIDNLNSYFGDGLRYYLLENQSPEGQVHGHALLCMRDWLTGNASGVATHSMALTEYTPDQLNNFFVIGRYFAAQLFEANVSGSDIYQTAAQVREYYNEFQKQRLVQQSFPCFEYIIAETLVLIGQYEEAYFYINEAIKKRNNHIPPHIDLRMLESIYLFQGIVMAQLGKVQQSKEILEVINVKNLSFMTRRFHSILYFLQKLQFHHTASIENQLAHLVSQTGFVRMVRDMPGLTELPFKSIDKQALGKNGQTNITIAN